MYVVYCEELFDTGGLKSFWPEESWIAWVSTCMGNESLNLSLLTVLKKEVL